MYNLDSNRSFFKQCLLNPPKHRLLDLDWETGIKKLRTITCVFSVVDLDKVFLMNKIVDDLKSYQTLCTLIVKFARKIINVDSILLLFNFSTTGKGWNYTKADFSFGWSRVSTGLPGHRFEASSSLHLVQEQETSRSKQIRRKSFTL